MKNFKKLTLGFVVLMTGFFSCEKDENQNVNVDKELLEAMATIDFTNELDFNSGIEVSNNGSSYSNRLTNQTSNIAPCAEVTVNNATPGVFPKVFTINFGSGCTINGITRSGTLTVTLSNYVLTNGSIMTVERGDNYYVNNKKIEGKVEYVNNTTMLSNPQWTRTVTNGKITTVEGVIFNHFGTRNVKQTAGVGTIVFADNVYEITSGTHSITRLGGATLNSTVIEPLIKKYTCNNISKGKLNLQGTIIDGVLDYGSNLCDNLATYTHVNGVVFNVVLN